MAGELWRRVTEGALETVPGTAVAGTRRMYWVDPTFEVTKDSTPRAFAVGRRDNVLDVTYGPKIVAGSASLPVSASEMLEPLLVGMKGAVAPTQPSAGPDPTVYLWTFTPGNALDTMTVRYHDGARVWIVSGANVNKFEIAGSVGGDNNVNLDFFARDMVAGSLTGSLPDRVPEFASVWETKLFIDALGGTPGTTNIPATLINWSFSFDNQMAREYFADNTQAAGDISSDELVITAKLTVRASSTAAIAEFDNWNNNVARLISCEFGQNKVISTTYKRFTRVTVPAKWTAVGLGGNENNRRTYELTCQYIYDSTLAAGMKIELQNSRATAW
jgi:hypothetical protein